MSEPALPALPPGLILLVEVGSTAHGTGLPGNEDRDEMGIVVESPRDVLGLGYGLETAVHRTKPEGVKSGPGDVDRTLYPLRKFLRLAAAGNPSILLALYAPVLEATLAGRKLQALAPAFVGRHVIPRYRGYMQTQIDKLERNSGQRQDLVDRHGYDTKFAMHAARLGFQGVELLTTGRLELPMVGAAGDWLRALRRGQIPKGEWRTRTARLDADLARLEDDWSLPAGPDHKAIDSFSVVAHRDAWQALSAKEVVALRVRR